ncbi:hypothetical protein ACERIT_14630 [Halopenitus sp. H-Gu1]|uniref:hypothetical protein n=1 Tax=Halopenitus sp. H-Gu1 TaxID=3242697 RepID=UPI00359E6CA8
MIEFSSGALPWLAAGILLLILGVLIKFRGWLFLLAGYDESSSVPDNVVQDIAGNTVLRVSIAALVVGVLISVMNPPSYLDVLVGIVIVLDMLRMIYRLNTWSPQAA